ncbi:MAG: hypothetical protein J6Y53_04130 [Alphaproteobacteria bacterium]|nr:hypothetical protein [Alphaproteobacteria bacterium]
MSEVRPPKAVKTTELEDGTIRYDYADGSYGIEDSRTGTLTIYADGQVNTYEKIADSDYRLVSSDIGTSISYFDEEGNMTESELAGGARYRYTENGFIREEGGAVEEVENGERTRVKDSLGNDFHYDSDGNLTDETQTVRREVELPEPVSVSVEVEGNIPRRNKMVYEDGTYGYEDLSTGDVTIHCGDSEEVYKKQENGKYILKEEKDPDRSVKYHDNGYPKTVDYKDENGSHVQEIYREDGRIQTKVNDEGESWEYNGKGICTHYRGPIREEEKEYDHQKDDVWRDIYYDDSGRKLEAVRRNEKGEVMLRTTYYPNGSYKEQERYYPAENSYKIKHYENGNNKSFESKDWNIEFYDNGQVKEINSDGKYSSASIYNKNTDETWETDEQYDYTKIKRQEFDRDGNLISEERFEKDAVKQNSTEQSLKKKVGSTEKSNDSSKESKLPRVGETKPTRSRLPEIDASKSKSSSLGYSGEANQAEGRAELRERNLARIEKLRQNKAERDGGSQTPIDNYAEAKSQEKADNNAYVMRWKAMQSQNG